VHYHISVIQNYLNTYYLALFEKHLEQYAPQDPLYEEYTNKKGKKKRRRRALPLGLSARDAKILKSVQRRAHYLDKGFSFCGMRFGWTFIIGLIPVVGDVADASVNYLLVVRKARQAELPDWLVRRMLVNNAISIAVGLIPLAGDVVLAIFKANSRNALLLEEYLRIRGEEFIKAETNKKPGTSNNGTVKNVNKPSKSDIEQIKPGAGKDTKQGAGAVDVEEGTMPNGFVEMATKKGNSILRWRPSNPVKGKANANDDEDDKEKEKLTAPPVWMHSERGKFFEDVSSSGLDEQSMLSGTSRQVAAK